MSDREDCKVMEEPPPQLQEHLRMCSEKIGTDYKKVILAIEGYVRSKKTWNTGPDDMDVDAVSKGKGQPKGKGKCKGKCGSNEGKGQPKGKGKGKSHRARHKQLRVSIFPLRFFMRTIRR